MAKKERQTKKLRKNKKTQAKQFLRPNTQKSNKKLFGIKRKMLLLFKIITALSVFVTLWVVSNPRIFVYTSVPLDPNHPVFTPFVVRNDGHLAIYDVKISSAMEHLETESGITIIGLGHYENKFTSPEDVAKVIDPTEEITTEIAFSKLKYKEFTKMDVALIISFRAKYHLWRTKRLRRFVTKKGKDGQWYWFPQPINKN